MPFPDIDPILLQIGPLAVRWYGIAYIAGLFLGVAIAKRLAQGHGLLAAEAFDDFMVWALIGIVLGGRLGSVVLYDLDHYLANPMELPKIWKGGMSFHGGLIGVAVAAIWFTKRRMIDPLRFLDILSCVAPIGLFFGRLANFVNGELYGRPTEMPWGVVFPFGGPVARHPSQLYEAALEGLLLLVLLNGLMRVEGVRRRPGLLCGAFLLGYGALRFLVEFTREPDATLMGPLTRGQAYCVPMVVVGVWLSCRALVATQRAHAIDMTGRNRES